MFVDGDVMNAVDAAEFLGIHVETLRRMARLNQIPCFKVGRDWRFLRESIIRWADTQRPSMSGGYILIVDDDEFVCRTMIRFLCRLGFSAQAAGNGLEGLELVRERTPDLILLDLKMPSMNGPRFLDQLRSRHPRLPVVIMTGYPDSELMAEAMRYAPVLLLSKPVNLELLESTVLAILEDRSGAVREGRLG